MSDYSETEKLLEQHSDNQVSVVFLPPDMFENGGRAQWIGQETRSSLREVIELIIAEEGNHSGYRVLVHEGDKDDFLDQDVIDKLISYVIATDENESPQG